MKIFLALAIVLGLTSSVSCQTADPASIRKDIGGLRAMPEAQRGPKTGAIARDIATLPDDKLKLGLALGLAHLSTEGDPGRDNLQAVTDTLSAALAGTPAPEETPGKPSGPYMELAALARYEGMKVSGKATEDPQYSAAIALLTHVDEDVEKSDFTLKDASGKKWTMAELRGKVVLLNFWATWCPPCRVELPNLDAIADHYASQGLVVLAVTDEDFTKVNNFFHGASLRFHVLFDTGRKVADKYHVTSLPRTYVFNREGKLVAVGVDGRTQRQFLLMLKKAGLQL